MEPERENAKTLVPFESKINHGIKYIERGKCRNPIGNTEKGKNYNALIKPITLII